MLNDARLLNVIANTLTVVAVLALLGGALAWLAQRPYFAVTRVHLEPLQSEALNYVSAATLQATVAGRLSGNFFSLRLDEVRSLIESAPWVRHAQVRREWPNALRVKIEEHQPLALWNDDRMINTWGEVFGGSQSELPDEQPLPQLSGPDNAERLVVQRYAEIARWFAPLGLSVEEVTLSPRYAWEVRLSSGLQLKLGRDPAAEATDPHGRPGALPFAARIERFVQSWPAIASHLEGRTMLIADLRYPNGYALRLADANQLNKTH